MPSPESRTVSSTECRPRAELTSISPSKVCLKALEMRFVTICSHIRRSTATGSFEGWVSTSSSRPPASTAERNMLASSSVSEARSIASSCGSTRPAWSRLKSRSMFTRVSSRSPFRRASLTRSSWLAPSRPAPDLRESVIERAEHEREGRPELVRDVREERCLRPIEIGQLLGAVALRFVGACAGDRGCDLARDQLDERCGRAVDRPVRVEPDDEKSGRFVAALRRKSHHHRVLGRSVPVAAHRRDEPIAAGQVEDDGAFLAQPPGGPHRRGAPTVQGKQ